MRNILGLSVTPKEIIALLRKSFHLKLWMKESNRFVYLNMLKGVTIWTYIGLMLINTSNVWISFMIRIKLINIVIQCWDKNSSLTMMIRNRSKTVSKTHFLTIVINSCLITIYFTKTKINLLMIRSIWFQLCFWTKSWLKRKSVKKLLTLLFVLNLRNNLRFVIDSDLESLFLIRWPKIQ